MSRDTALFTERIVPAGLSTGLNKGADLQSASGKPIAGIGRVLLWSGGSLWIGRAAGLAQAHSHHAIQLSLALSGKVRFRIHADGPWSEYCAAIVLPHQRHQFDGNGQSVAQIFIEPETVQGRALLKRFTGGVGIRPVDESIETVAESLRLALAEEAADRAFIVACQCALTQLSGEDLSLGTDPRISRSIDWIRSRLNTSLSLKEAAAVAHLSPGRFRHLFVSQTGITFRAYILWARVSTAVGAGLGGLSWTEAAQTCGFSDSAHLSRTCRRMFGIAPSMLIREAVPPVCR